VSDGKKQTSDKGGIQMYHVALEVDDGIIGLMDGDTIDELPMRFHEECIQRVNGDFDQLLTKHRFSIVNTEGDSFGMMLWVKAAGHDDPVLVVQLNRKDGLDLYDIYGDAVEPEDIGVLGG
jgi:hypothetical protein